MLLVAAARNASCEISMDENVLVFKHSESLQVCLCNLSLTHRHFYIYIFIYDILAAIVADIGSDASGRN